MKGTLCPNCRQQVMSFRQFLREADHHRVYRCVHCGAALRRPPWDWLLIPPLGVFLVLTAILTSAYIPNRWLVVGATLAGLSFLMMSVFLTFLSWLLIGWVPEAGQTDDPSP
jgi:hypothetical protein